jgi:hypothetical protein
VPGVREALLSFELVPIEVLRTGLNSANPQAFTDNMRESLFTAPIHSEYQFTLFEPREKASERAGVGASRVPVVDIRREEFNVTPASLLALTGDQRRRQGSVLDANERTTGGNDRTKLRGHADCLCKPNALRASAMV